MRTCTPEQPKAAEQPEAAEQLNNQRWRTQMSSSPNSIFSYCRMDKKQQTEFSRVGWGGVYHINMYGAHIFYGTYVFRAPPPMGWGKGLVGGEGGRGSTSFPRQQGKKVGNIYIYMYVWLYYTRCDNRIFPKNGRLAVLPTPKRDFCCFAISVLVLVRKKKK